MIRRASLCILLSLFSKAALAGEKSPDTSSWPTERHKNCPEVLSDNGLLSYVPPFVSSAEIEKRLNARYVASIVQSERRRIHEEKGLNESEPFKVLENSSLLPDNQMPELSPLGSITIVRADRRNGIAQIRSAVHFSEERSWIFIPSLQIWIYDSVEFATSTSVGRSSFLAVVLLKEFGSIELFHTHPNVAAIDTVQRRREEIDRYGWALNSVRLAVLGLPSRDDLQTVLNLFDQENRNSKLDVRSSIVHAYGVTSYSARAYVQKNPDGSQNYIFPQTGNLRRLYEVLDESTDPSTAITNALDFMSSQSIDSLAHFSDDYGWDSTSIPRYFFSFQSID